MRFRLLGSLEVTDDDGNEVPVHGWRLRRLLAALLTRRNTTVPRETLVEDIWNSRPPASTDHGLDVLVSRLRSLLASGTERRLRTRPGGYALTVHADELDVARFEEAVARGLASLETGDLHAAVRSLRDGLAEWRGRAYGELASASFAVEDALRLDEERLSAVELLFECELRLGRHREIEPELDAFVAANPLHEGARAALMLALYRSGRQVDALRVYRSGARSLAEQGLEPGAELRLMQRCILRHDPSLDRQMASPTQGWAPAGAPERSHPPDRARA